MAKGPRTDDDDGAALPGLDELLHGPKEGPKPQPSQERPASDDELLGPLPQPGEAPRPEGVKVRVKAGTAPPADEVPKKGKSPARKKGGLAKAKDYTKDKLWFLFPPDPVEKMRVKLRLLGLIKFVIAPIVIVTLVALLMMFLWYTFWDYSSTVAVMSHEVLAILFLVPAALGVFVAIYLPLTVFLFNRYEDRWNWILRDMLRKNIKFKIDRPGKAQKARPRAALKKPKVAEPEEPLPQPTVRATDI
jgi:hypothetical protein